MERHESITAEVFFHAPSSPASVCWWGAAFWLQHLKQRFLSPTLANTLSSFFILNRRLVHAVFPERTLCPKFLHTNFFFFFILWHLLLCCSLSPRRLMVVWERAAPSGAASGASCSEIHGSSWPRSRFAHRLFCNMSNSTLVFTRVNVHTRGQLEQLCPVTDPEPHNATVNKDWCNVHRRCDSQPHLQLFLRRVFLVCLRRISGELSSLGG